MIYLILCYFTDCKGEVNLGRHEYFILQTLIINISFENREKVKTTTYQTLKQPSTIAK